MGEQERGMSGHTPDRPSPTDLSELLDTSTNAINDLYYVGRRWMDRARKAENLNADLLKALKEVGDWLSAQYHQISDPPDEIIGDIRVAIVKAEPHKADDHG